MDVQKLGITVWFLGIFAPVTLLKITYFTQRSTAHLMYFAIMKLLELDGNQCFFQQQ